MGSSFQWDVAGLADGVGLQPDHWRDFDPGLAPAFDQEEALARQAGLEGPKAAVLVRAIQHEVIPRLMLVHRQQAGCRSINAASTEAIGAREIEHFVRLLREGSEQSALEMMAALQARGTLVEAIYLQLLAPAARLLGELWEQDACDFTEVTMALGRVQRMLHFLSPRLEQHRPDNFHGLSILLLAAPGEQHTLGLAMVGDFFRRAGWEVCGKPGANTAQIAALLSSRMYDALGFSLAAESNLDALTQAIACVRRAAGSCPKCIVVGGPVFASHPEYGSRVGADLVATDGRTAPTIVRHFVTADSAFDTLAPRTFQ